ncbi:MAG: DUF1737 domain-containing protein [Methanothrix sp.]|jgi:hypothetical protein|nr:DUF1737 domain-containing protein [Methanothrix sp.]
MIKDYKILKSSSYVTLEQIVKKHIKEGWEPLGGVAVTANGECYQALIKRD